MNKTEYPFSPTTPSKGIKPKRMINGKPLKEKPPKEQPQKGQPPKEQFPLGYY